MHTQSQQQPNEIASAVTEAFSAPAPRPQIYTVAIFAKRNRDAGYTESAVRNLVFNGEPRESSVGTIPGNGLIEAGAVLRVGRKVLINELKFFEWIESRSARLLESNPKERSVSKRRKMISGSSKNHKKNALERRPDSTPSKGSISPTRIHSE